MKALYRRIHRLYLSNVFICNLTMGSVVYICFMLMKFDCKTCALRDASFVCVVIFTNVNQLSMICILICHIRSGVSSKNLLDSNRCSVANLLHIAANIASWLFSVIIVAIMILQPETKGILIFTFCKTICILVLGIYAIRYIRKGMQLSKKNSRTEPKSKEANEGSDTTSCKTAVIIMTAFLMITIVTWCPLLTVLALQKFEVIGTKELASSLMVATRFVCLGPLIDPIFYFWSQKMKTQKMNRISNGRTK